MPAPAATETDELLGAGRPALEPTARPTDGACMDGATIARDSLIVNGYADDQSFPSQIYHSETPMGQVAELCA